MTRRTIFDHKFLVESVDYCADTGVAIWKNRPTHHFALEWYHKAWNKRFAGKRIGTKKKFIDGGKLYYVCGFANKPYLLHRIIWFVHYGDWPKYTIDHINGDGLDNRLCNLRDVPMLENAKNIKHTGKRKLPMGVYKTRREKYAASIGVAGKQIHLGTFNTIDDAIAARQSKIIELGFHQLHGTERPV